MDALSLSEKPVIRQYKRGQPHYDTEKNVVELDIRGVPDSSELYDFLENHHMTPKKHPHLPTVYALICGDKRMSEEASMAIIRGWIKYAETPQANGQCPVFSSLSFALMTLSDSDEVLELLMKAKKVIFPGHAYGANGLATKIPSIKSVSFSGAKIHDDTFTLILRGLQDEENITSVCFDGFHIGDKGLRLLNMCIGRTVSHFDRMKASLKKEYRGKGFWNMDLMHWKKEVDFSFKNVSFSQEDGVQKLFAALANRRYIPQFYVDETDCSAVSEANMEKVMQALHDKPPRADGLDEFIKYPHCACSFNGSKLTKPLSQVVAKWLAKCSSSRIALRDCDVNTGETQLFLLEAAEHCLHPQQIYLSDPLFQQKLRKHCRSTGKPQILQWNPITWLQNLVSRIILGRRQSSEAQSSVRLDIERDSSDDENELNEGRPPRTSDFTANIGHKRQESENHS